MIKAITSAAAYPAEATPLHATDSYRQVIVFNDSAADLDVRITTARGQALDYRVPAGYDRGIGLPPQQAARALDIKAAGAPVTVTVEAERTSETRDYIVARGPQGVQGPAGPQGAAGPAGPQGAAGADGADGADGVNYGATSQVFAYLDDGQVIAGGATDKVVFNVETIDPGGAWSLTQGEFTAPADGTYTVDATLAFTGSTTVQAHVYIDDGGGYDPAVRGGIGGEDGNAGSGTATVHCLLSLTAGHKVAIYGQNHGGGGATVSGDAGGVPLSYVSFVRQS